MSHRPTLLASNIYSVGTSDFIGQMDLHWATTDLHGAFAIVAGSGMDLGHQSGGDRPHNLGQLFIPDALFKMPCLVESLLICHVQRKFVAEWQYLL